MFRTYQPRQSPDLSPPTRRTARRCGSNRNRIRISLEPEDPGLSSFMWWWRDAFTRSTSGRPGAGPSSASFSTVAATRVIAAIVEVQQPRLDFAEQPDVPAHLASIASTLYRSKPIMVIPPGSPRVQDPNRTRPRVAKIQMGCERPGLRPARRGRGVATAVATASYISAPRKEAEASAGGPFLRRQSDSQSHDRSSRVRGSARLWSNVRRADRNSYVQRSRYGRQQRHGDW